MVNIENIQNLIDLYWKGETTPDEEKAISAFFSSNTDLPPEMEQWREWFAGKESLSNIGLSSAIDEKVLAYIEQSTARPSRLRRIWLTSAAIAASILLVCILRINHQEPASVSQEMTYAEMQDYETVKELLFLASAKMNQAGNTLEENLGKMEVMNEFITLK